MNSPRPFFLQKYEEARPTIAKSLGVENPHKIPRIKKVTLHTRYGRYLGDNAKKRFAKEVMEKIAGQLPCDAKARKSVSQFKVRTGMICGCFVTLRHKPMYEFLARLWIALPRMRNFNGFKKNGFDKMGNFNFGVEDHASFLEVENMIDYRFGFDVSIATTANNSQEGLLLMETLGMPFIKEGGHGA